MLKSSKPSAEPGLATGNHAAIIRQHHEFRTPDFSYLMITDLREYYYNKHNLLSISRSIVTQMASLLQHYSANIASEIQATFSAIQRLESTTAHHEWNNVINLATEFQTIISNAANESINTSDLIHRINTQCGHILNLHNFIKMEPLQKVSYPCLHHSYC